MVLTAGEALPDYWFPMQSLGIKLVGGETNLKFVKP